MSENKMTRYMHNNYVWVNIQFNKNNKEEMMLHKWLSDKGKSKASYIKQLIKADMEKAGR